MSDVATPSARERMAECDETLGVIRERLAEAEAELAAMSIKDPKRHTLRRNIAAMRADIEDAQAQRAALVPAAKAEREVELHAARVAHHAAILQATEAAVRIPELVDSWLSDICRTLPAYLNACEEAGAAAGVNPNPFRLDEGIPTRAAIADIVLGRLVAAGVLGMEHLPQRFQDEPIFRDELRRAGLLPRGQVVGSPIDIAATASLARDVHGPFLATIRNASPERQKQHTAEAAALSQLRAEREAADMAAPARREPSQPPRVHAAPPIVHRGT